MKDKSISLQFVPHTEIAYLSSFKRIKFLVDLAIQNKILLVQGSLESTEQADLIEETMRRIKGSSKFKGIEIATFVPQNKGLSMFDALKEGVARALIGDRDQFTIIGPASLVREIKKDPTKIELLLRK
jgi:hypothetical protein